MKHRNQIRVKVYGRQERVELFLKTLDETFLEMYKGSIHKDVAYKDVKLYIELDPAKVRQKLKQKQHVPKLRAI